ncbi:MAG: outer membrane lipoprotein-sorting protein [Treponema sp.]
MNKYTPVRTGFYFAFFFLLVLPAAAETAEDIVRSARSQAEITSVGTRAKMEIQKDGITLNELVIDQYSSRDSKHSQRTFMEFKAPAQAKGTRFLMITKENGTLDQRIYLPSLGKIRRIAGAAEGTQSFMGTDFSYNDIAYMERDSNLDIYRLEPEETYNELPCYVIEARPKDNTYEYAKTRIWIEKESKHFIKAEFYNKKEAVVKTIEISEYQTIQGIDTPMITKMTTHATGTSTSIHILKMQYNMKIPEKVFTPRYLEQGR